MQQRFAFYNKWGGLKRFEKWEINYIYIKAYLHRNIKDQINTSDGRKNQKC
jgi:hypothetical protein